MADTIKKWTVDLDDFKELVETILALTGPLGMGAAAIIRLFASWRQKNPTGAVTDFVVWVRTDLIEPATQDAVAARTWLTDRGWTRNERGEWVPPGEPIESSEPSPSGGQRIDPGLVRGRDNIGFPGPAPVGPAPAGTVPAGTGREPAGDARRPGPVPSSPTQDITAQPKPQSPDPSKSQEPQKPR